MTAQKDPFPLAPPNLAAAYADIAAGYHKRLPELRDEVDRIHGITLAAHGLASSIDQRLRVVEGRVEDIAVATRAKRRTSGEMQRVSLPPPAPPLDLRPRATDTGHNIVIPREEFDELVQKIRDREAAERGAKETLELVQKEHDQRMAEEKATRDLWTFRIGMTVAVLGLTGTSAWWAIQHLVIR
jgi:hypothetical protein